MLTYFANNFFSAKLFAIIMPFLVGLLLYVAAMLYFKKIDVYIFLIFFIFLSTIAIGTTSMVITEITQYDENPNTFFLYYFIGGLIMLTLWVIMYFVQIKLERVLFGENTYNVKNLFNKK